MFPTFPGFKLNGAYMPYAPALHINPDGSIEGIEHEYYEVLAAKRNFKFTWVGKASLLGHYHLRQLDWLNPRDTKVRGCCQYKNTITRMITEVKHFKQFLLGSG